MTNRHVNRSACIYNSVSRPVKYVNTLQVKSTDMAGAVSIKMKGTCVQ